MGWKMWRRVWADMWGNLCNYISHQEWWLGSDRRPSLSPLSHHLPSRATTKGAKIHFFSHFKECLALFKVIQMFNPITYHPTLHLPSCCHWLPQETVAKYILSHVWSFLGQTLRIRRQEYLKHAIHPSYRHPQFLIPPPLSVPKHLPGALYSRL